MLQQHGLGNAISLPSWEEEIQKFQNWALWLWNVLWVKEGWFCAQAPSTGSIPGMLVKITLLAFLAKSQFFIKVEPPCDARNGSYLSGPIMILWKCLQRANTTLPFIPTLFSQQHFFFFLGWKMLFGLYKNTWPCTFWVLSKTEGGNKEDLSEVFFM